MKAKEVLDLLKVTRQTLNRYVKQNKIKVTKLHNGYYDYDKDDVYKLFYHNVQRKTCLYARVSTNKRDLENQINLIKEFCLSNNIAVNQVYKDIAIDTEFKKRKELFTLLDKVIEGKIDNVVIVCKDVLSKTGFDLFKHLFDKYNTKIINISENK